MSSASRLTRLTLGGLLCLATPLVADPVPAPGELLPGGAAAWNLVWNEEFEGTEADLDRRWVSQNSASTHILSGRWRENASVSEGTLKLLNKKESRGGNDWTSGNVWTRDKFQYGYFEARYRYAAAPATNNSFWLMPVGKEPITRGAYFEIDINEGHYPNEVNTKIHNHSVPKNTPGKRSPRAFSFGTRPDITIQLENPVATRPRRANLSTTPPDITIQLENPVATRRIRFSSTHPGRTHLGEFRVYNANPAGYPDPFSATADLDKPGLVNFARDPATTIVASGSYRPEDAAPGPLVDGLTGTRWITQ